MRWIASWKRNKDRLKLKSLDFKGKMILLSCSWLMTLKDWVEIKRSNREPHRETFILTAALGTTSQASSWKLCWPQRDKFLSLFSIYDDSCIKSSINSYSQRNHSLERCNFWSKCCMMDCCWFGHLYDKLFSPLNKLGKQKSKTLEATAKYIPVFT